MLIPTDAEKLAQSGGTTTSAIVSGRYASTTVSIKSGASETVKFTPSERGAWTTVDDFSPSIGYSSGWAATTGLEGFFNGTAHYTIDPGATADLGFNRTAVRVIGDCNTDHGQFTVTIDGAFQGWYDAWCNEQRPREVLFETDSLTAGSHTIEIAASGVQDGQATGVTDPELGSMVPDDLFTLDAIQYGNFGVNEIETTSAPQPTTSGVPGPGSVRLGKASPGAAGRAFLVSVHAAASDRVTARVGCRGSHGPCSVILTLQTEIRADQRVGGRTTNGAFPLRAGSRVDVLRRIRVSVRSGQIRAVRLTVAAEALHGFAPRGTVDAWLYANETSSGRPLIGRRRVVLPVPARRERSV